MDAEHYTLAPSVIVDKARQLRSAGLFKQALELLLSNCVEVSVYPTRVEMKLAREINDKAERARREGAHRMARTQRAQRSKRVAQEGGGG